MGIFDWMGAGGQGGGGGGGYMDQMVNYGMQFGGPQFGISPDQRANYFKQQEQATNLKFINDNTIPGDPTALPIGNNRQELDAAIARQQPRFNPAKEQELALRTGQMGQYIAGQQAMQRQQQQQQFLAENMTAGQRAEYEVATMKLGWEKERHGMEFNADKGMTYAQAAANQVAQGHLGVSQGNLAVNRAQLGMQQQRLAFDQGQAQREALYPALGLKGQPAMDYRAAISKMDNAAAITTDVADYLSTVGSGGKALDRGTVNAMQSAYQQHVVPALTTMVGTGTIQKGDMEFVQGVMGDPGAWTTLDSRQKQKVMQILTSVEDERNRLYGLSGVRAPATKKGGSAWARSREGATSAPEDTVWGP